MTAKQHTKENAHRPIVLCVSGLKNSGKTALIEAIIPMLAAKGIRTAVIKHHGHGFEGEIPDRPGTDTYRFLESGAYGTVIYDDALLMCVRREPATLTELVALFSAADLILVEGAKGEQFPRIAMLRTDQPLTSAECGLLCAVTDPDYDARRLPDGLPRFDFGDFEHVAELLTQTYFTKGA